MTCKNFKLAMFLTLVISSLLVSGEKITKFKKASADDDDVKLPTRLIELEDNFKQSKYRESKSFTPVVFWHGMGDTAFGSINPERLAIQRLFPNITVLSVQIGNNEMEDRLASYFANVNTQIDNVCEQIINDPRIRSHGSFNAIGYSQGAQILRGLIQRCPFKQNDIRVKNFISLGGQHQGVFGLPNCLLKGFCEYINYLLSEGAYEQKIQETLIQAAYWHDPTKEAIYRDKSIFIADINNEKDINSTYKDNLLQLDTMVLVEFLQDRMVIPRESSLFGYYKEGSTKEVASMRDSKLYIEDRIGLKELDDSSRLHLISVPGDHLQYKISWFIDNIALKYLNN